MSECVLYDLRWIPKQRDRDRKRQKDRINMVGYVGDSEYGIPTRCPCGGRIIDELSVKEDYDTLPGKRFFSCRNFEGDGLHYRQPWVIGVQEELERLTKRVEVAEEVIKGISTINKQIEFLEEQVKELSGQVEYLTVHIGDLGRLCYE